MIIKADDDVSMIRGNSLSSVLVVVAGVLMGIPLWDSFDEP